MASAFVTTRAESNAPSQALRQAFTCSGYKPFARQYSDNSATVRGAVSSTTPNLALEVQTSAFRPSPGAATPASSASLRHAYSVPSVTPCSFDNDGIVAFSGGIILPIIFSFNSLGYFILFLRCPLLPSLNSNSDFRDNYPDIGGSQSPTGLGHLGFGSV